ncbi:MAG: hypothetical protein GX998_03110 [Firmicutes bacterium]|nr:hypothetical protein [Bacillota bacterium]
MLHDSGKRAEQIKVLQEAIESIAQHPTLDCKAKQRGIQPLQLALRRLAGKV